eukprot:CAMPEP_0194202248 /NCGR_PEP_ID=MMETSP0156-20130528/2320_1 /TAXON_ID=33649 /ORGANISM="Thalassionema nitzschioides, Strain L26-B" /LENGTH=121 /DNA_ID=CAMNT_0038927685 /DNA_START=50 /DNA_END=415 /DNA_ORIENTATION=-
MKIITACVISATAVSGFAPSSLLVRDTTLNMNSWQQPWQPNQAGNASEQQRGETPGFSQEEPVAQPQGPAFSGFGHANAPMGGQSSVFGQKKSYGVGGKKVKNAYGVAGRKRASTSYTEGL